ncbi:hypothetical protein O6P43_020560 [Quillaja saponaria]|uniref:Secreted protein n=1 Tax=Quillaja saponaria TaxID=32244 RepID=A0AAD7LLB2_QUISA|nr:hypothetical protein O6P43_020560 [Quillaja saponaria]
MNLRHAVVICSSFPIWSCLVELIIQLPRSTFDKLNTYVELDGVSRIHDTSASCKSVCYFCPCKKPL